MGLQLSVRKKEEKRQRQRYMQHQPYPGMPPGYGSVNPSWPGAPYTTMPVIPQGFGQGIVPSAIPWPASQQMHKRKRTRNPAAGRRRHLRSATDPAMNLPAGFIPSTFMPNVNDGPRVSMPQPVVAPSMGRAPSQGQPPPLFTPGPNNSQNLTSFPSPQIPTANVPSQGGRGGGSSNGHAPSRRAPTPFIPHISHDDEDDDDDDDSDSDDMPVIPDIVPSQRGHRQTASMPDPTPFLAQMYARPQRPPNRLPEPPKVFDRTPFKRLVDLPMNGAAFIARANTTTAIEMINPDAGIAGIGANGAQKKKSRLLRGLSFRGNRQDSASRPGNGNMIPVTRIVPIVMSDRTGSGVPINGAATGADPPSAVPSTSSSVPPPPPPSGPTSSGTSTSTSQPPIRFTHKGPFSGFDNSARCPITYQGRVFPTAAHLYEARRYMDVSPEAGEAFMQCELSEIMGLSARFHEKERPDWSVVFLQVLDEILYLKMVQHEQLRRLLLDTGSAPIVFGDRSDFYWGEGPTGNGGNELGKALVRVRNKLRADGYT